MFVVVMGLGRLGGSVLALLHRGGVRAEGWRRGDPVPPGADAYWITTRDDAVPQVAALVPPDAVALHAAGAHGPDLLAPHADRGVLHPLMTFPGVSHGIPELRGVGARVAGTPRAEAAARDLAGALGMVPFVFHGDVRRYHASACLASGHLGALFLDAARVLEAEGLSPEDARARLLPLALESLRRAADGGAGALTGPAARGDTATVQAHLGALTPDISAVYLALTERIRRLVKR